MWVLISWLILQIGAQSHSLPNVSTLVQEWKLDLPEDRVIGFLTVASWCPHCHQALRQLDKEIEGKSGSKIEGCGVDWYVVSVDDRPAGFYRLKGEFSRFQVLWDQNRKWRNSLSIQVIPHVIFFKSNQVIWQYEGQDFWGKWPKEKFVCDIKS